MTDLASYAFVPWVRRDLASLARTSPTGNALSLQVSLAVNNVATNPVSVRLYGPGQVMGIDARIVARTEPRANSTSFEPNYFACVEFGSADFPWLLSPMIPSGVALRPWLCLVVVREQPGVVLVPRTKALSLLQFTDPADPRQELPNLDQITAWAHAQTVGPTAATPAALQAGITDGLNGPAAAQLSRIICPRRLEQATSYLACLVPTYRVGVQAGVSPDLPVNDGDVAPAWDGAVAAPFALPVYYSWRFSTGAEGDFASLARRLRPPKEPLQLGLRDVDASTPGFGLPQFPNLVLGLEGALLSPESTPKPWPEGMQPTFGQALRSILVPPQAAVPIVTPPVYGAVPASSPLPMPDALPAWMRELNVDPRFRAVAGFGTSIIRAHQEDLMASAWEQYEAIRRANQLLRQMQLARAVSSTTRARHFSAAGSGGVLMQLTRPLHARLRLDPGSTLTLEAQVTASRIATGAVSASFRRLSRRRGPLGRNLFRSGTPSCIVERLNLAAGTAQAVVVEPPRAPPIGIVVLDSVSTQTTITDLTPLAVSRATGWVVTRATTGGPVDSSTSSRPNGTPHVAAPSAAVSGTSSGAVGTEGAGHGVALRPVDGGPIGEIGGVRLPRAPDLPDDIAIEKAMALRFRQAATAVATYVSTRTARIADDVDKPPLSTTLDLIQSLTLAAIDPATTLVARAQAQLPLPSTGDPLRPLSGNPTFPEPMSTELTPQQLLPGVERVPSETAALLVTNPTFVEAFMVGLNDEMRREMAWRQYPADQRATFFTHFWSTSLGAATAEDIPPIANWQADRRLGENATTHGEQVVLLLRGELLRRYPNTIISAVKAKLGPNNVRSLGDDERFPLFRGSIDPDMVYFGFALGKDEALAGEGFYFVLAEHPTEPRFGFEPAQAPGTLNSWNDLSWPQVPVTRNHVDLAVPPPAHSMEGASWNSSSADQAFIAFRRPVRLALHASALLG